MYSERALKEFRHPKNIGEIKNPDGLGKVGNAQCGDLLWTYIKVGKNKKGEEILEDIKVKTFGCVAAIATSSMITELAIGKTLEEAKKITRDNIARALEGLPAIKMHCSNLAADGLHKAIEEYEKRKTKV